MDRIVQLQYQGSMIAYMGINKPWVNVTRMTFEFETITPSITVCMNA